MTRLAVAGEKGFEASDIEIQRGGPSLTADTVVELNRLHPRDELFLILGWDAARLFSTWHRPDEIRKLASVVVVSRPGTPPPGERELGEAGLDPARVILCSRPTPDISGSALRDAIARGDSVSDRVPSAVERYIADHGLYRGGVG
jgi:nicotinate-nucleotide adenylyltransferase